MTALARNKCNIARYLLLLIAICICKPWYVYAQCDSAESAKEYADSVLIPGTNQQGAASIFFPGQNGGTLYPMREVMPVFKFSIDYPSLNSEIAALFTEFTLNNQKIILKNWCKDQEKKNWDENRLNEDSKTIEFSVASGDEIRFFRILRYKYNDKYSTGLLTIPFMALDDISWSITLHDALSRQVITLLDTLKAEKNTNSQKMIVNLFAHRPLSSVVSYKIPPNFGSVNYWLLLIILVNCKHTLNCFFYTKNYDDNRSLSMSQMPEYRCHPLWLQ